MKIGVIGTRGFPEIQGGIETHCLELYTRLAEMDDHSVTVYRRIPYLNSKNRLSIYKNIRFVDFAVPRNKFLETFLHSFLSTLHSLFQKYDVVHYHNTGPGFFAPLIRLSKARVVFTYHNISYTQQKWNSFAKGFLSFSERISIKNSDYIIFISEVLRGKIAGKYRLPDDKVQVIFNGVNMPEKSTQLDYIEELGLEKHKYIIGVGRFLEEKGFDYLIRSFNRANLTGYRLVLVGDTDYPTQYSRQLKSLAAENGVLLTGFIKGEKLKQIYSFARLFVISSFSEGLPIALLEAMSYNLDVLASDIPENLQINLNDDDYFRVGDEDALRQALARKLNAVNIRSFDETLFLMFNWDKIARDTNEIYQNLKISNEN
ncbi:MAG: glycosyltransferase family 4 protein [Bacteroidales bacterium]|nr:glycosyltransferase family 4 protein [Bacteroidales bacterium]